LSSLLFSTISATVYFPSWSQAVYHYFMVAQAA